MTPTISFSGLLDTLSDNGEDFLTVFVYIVILENKLTLSNLCVAQAEIVVVC